MIELPRGFTSQEQSKKLLELGVPANSADCYRDDNGYLHEINDDNLFRDKFFEFYGRQNDYKPCWSVGRLLEIAHVCGKAYFTHCWCDKPVLDNMMRMYELHAKDYDFSKLDIKDEA